MDMMRMDSSGKNLVCRNCLERKPSAQKQEPTKAQPLKHAEEESPMKEYFCKECKYNFKRARHLTIKTCPYCNSGSVASKGSTARIMSDAFRMKGAD